MKAHMQLIQEAMMAAQQAQQMSGPEGSASPLSSENADVNTES